MAISAEGGESGPLPDVTDSGRQARSAVGGIDCSIASQPRCAKLTSRSYEALTEHTRMRRAWKFDVGCVMEFLLVGNASDRE